MRVWPIWNQSPLTKCELLVLHLQCTLGVSLENKGGGTRQRAWLYTSVDYAESKWGDCLGPESVEGPNNPASHAAQLPQAAASWVGVPHVIRVQAAEVAQWFGQSPNCRHIFYSQRLAHTKWHTEQNVTSQTDLHSPATILALRSTLLQH